MSHTPGLWVVDPIDQDGEIWVGQKDGELVCVLFVTDEPGTPQRGEAEANACLIAAAPELLEATRESLNVLTRVHEDGGCPACEEEYQHNCPVLLGLEASIAKAEGRS